MRYRLDLAYDGAAFHGWATQTGLRTVQGELETWLPRVLRLDHATPLTVAGRTDAGVHARGQVAHVDLPSAGLGSELVRRLGRVLPPDVVVREASEVPDAFDARFSALWRRYTYRLADGPVDPLHRGMVLGVRRPIDVRTLGAAGAAVVGLRDFAAFCRRREGATTVRHVLDCSARRAADGELAGVVEVAIRADAFCHSMVRSLVGALVAVATAERDLAWLTAHLARSSRADDVTVLPPHGLVLEEVGYPDADGLASRQAEARARRTLDDEEAGA